MKHILLLLAIFPFVNLSANSFTDYKQNSATDRLLIIFDKTVSAERKAEIIQQSGLVTSFVHLPSPTLTICHTNSPKQKAPLVKPRGLFYFSNFCLPTYKLLYGVQF